MWHHASAAALKGVALVHGIAFGSPMPEISSLRFYDNCAALNAISVCNLGVSSYSNFDVNHIVIQLLIIAFIQLVKLNTDDYRKGFQEFEVFHRNKNPITIEQ